MGLLSTATQKVDILGHLLQHPFVQTLGAWELGRGSRQCYLLGARSLPSRVHPLIAFQVNLECSPLSPILPKNHPHVVRSTAFADSVHVSDFRVLGIVSREHTVKKIDVIFALAWRP